LGLSQLSWIATVLGMAAAEKAGISPRVFAPNILALLLGVILIPTAKVWLSAVVRHPSWLGPAALLAIALTFCASGDDGVHRWLTLGHLRLNAAMAVTPLVIYGVFAGTERNRLVLCFGYFAVCFMQPDASQATAFFFAVLPILLLRSNWNRRTKILALAVLTAAAGATWLRSDPLDPIPQVELILHLMGAQGIGGILSAVVAVSCLLIPLAMMVLRLGPDPRWILATGFLFYEAASIGVTEFGSFPVPLIGAGAAPVYLGPFVKYESNDWSVLGIEF
jgi:hypothetical protein